MERVKYILLAFLLLVGCRSIEKTTEEQSEKVTTENLVTDTETLKNSITEIKIPAHIFQQFLNKKYDTVNSVKPTQTATASKDTTSDVVTITTKENTVTNTKAEKDVTVEETKQSETKVEKKATFNWNYIWLIVGVCALLIITPIVYKLWL